MRHCGVTDSSFLVAVVNPDDTYHSDARDIFDQLLAEDLDVTVIVPPIAIYEVISVLARAGFDHGVIEEHIMKLLRIPKIITLSIAELSAFRHARTLLREGDQSGSLRTADFMIACIGLDFEAQILTFDRKVIDKVKSVYSKIYYCSSVGGYPDETSDFLEELKLLS